MDVWSKIGDCFSAFSELRILLDIDGNSAFYELRIFLDIDGNFWDCRCILLLQERLIFLDASLQK
jgi:uncharacterized protein YrzB (UPF0473 family)